MSEKVHLENYNFTSSLTSSLCSLLTSSTLCDCTLICPDGQLSAHKVILAASSSFFSSVFSLHHQQHYVIYLRGIRTDQMQAVLSYVYQGATQLDQEDLPSFLAVAEDLKIQGLTRYNEKTEKVKHGKATEMLHTDLQTKMVKEIHMNDIEVFNKHTKSDKTEHEIKDKGEKKQSFSCTGESIQSNISSENIDQIEEDLEDEFEDITSEELNEKDNKMFTAMSENVGKIEEETLTDKSVIEMENTGFDAATGSNTILNDHTDQSDTEVMDKEAKNVKSSPKENNFEILPKYKKYKTKDPYFLPDSLVKTVSCPVCKMKNKDNLNLKKHMKSKREVQCENCMLYFRNCNSLSVHIKSRCRNINKTIN